MATTVISSLICLFIGWGLGLIHAEYLRRAKKMISVAAIINVVVLVLWTFAMGLYVAGVTENAPHWSLTIFMGAVMGRNNREMLEYFGNIFKKGK